MKTRAEIPFGRQVLFWLFITTAIIALLWLLSGMLLPFVLGMALAYVSDPFRRPARTAVLSTLAGQPSWFSASLVGLGILTLVLVIPVIANQAMQLVEQTPHYLDLARHRFLPQLTQFVARVGGPHDAADVQKAAGAYVGSVSSWIFGMLSHVWSSGPRNRQCRLCHGADAAGRVLFPARLGPDGGKAGFLDAAAPSGSTARPCGRDRRYSRRLHSRTGNRVSDRRRLLRGGAQSGRIGIWRDHRHDRGHPDLHSVPWGRSPGWSPV